MGGRDDYSSSHKANYKGPGASPFKVRRLRGFKHSGFSVQRYQV